MSRQPGRCTARRRGCPPKREPVPIPAALLAEYGEVTVESRRRLSSSWFGATTTAFRPSFFVPQGPEHAGHRPRTC